MEKSHVLMIVAVLVVVGVVVYFLFFRGGSASSGALGNAGGLFGASSGNGSGTGATATGAPTGPNLTPVTSLISIAPAVNGDPVGGTGGGSILGNAHGYSFIGPSINANPSGWQASADAYTAASVQVADNSPQPASTNGTRYAHHGRFT